MKTLAYFAVLRLLGRCGPAAIARPVVAIVVDAIERVARWSRPHVGEEPFERSPLTADRNTSASVATVAGVVWIPASFMHRGPAVVLRRGAVVCSVAVFGDGVAVQAAAALRVASRKAAAQDCRFIAALTSAAPEQEARIASLSRRFDCHETPEHHAGYVLRMTPAPATYDVAVSQVIVADRLQDTALATTRPHSLLPMIDVPADHNESAERSASQIGSTYAVCSHACCSSIAVGLVRGWALFLQRSASLILPPAMEVTA